MSDTKHYFSSGVYAREMHLKKNHFADTHKHSFDHMSILAGGIAVVESGNDVRTYTAPACIEIKAGLAHKITALEDVVWFCIHATNETDLNKIDHTLIEGN